MRSSVSVLLFAVVASAQMGDTRLPAWCRARLPVPGGFLVVERQEGKVAVFPPAGYRIARPEQGASGA